MDWSYDSLWNKSKLYAQRAFSEKKSSYLFPLEATIALEFLSRATLAKVHPALLADPQSGDNILYACGYGNVKVPHSVPAKTVFLRCKEMVTDFTEADFSFAMSFVEKRNEELHSGGLPYENFPTEQWLANYFRACQRLLAFLGLKLEDLFGPEYGIMGQEMIVAANETRKGETLKLVSAHKTIYAELSDDEKKEKIKVSENRLKRLSEPNKVADCPSCGQKCFIIGKVISTSEPRLEDEYLIIETVVFPTDLSCSVCGLRLKSHEALHTVQLGGQFTVEEEIDPNDFYKSDFDPSEYYGEEYANE